MILSDREILAAIEQKRIIIEPPPDPAFMDSTTVDLRLHEELNQWKFPEHTEGLGQNPPKFCPGAKSFNFTKLEKDFTKPIQITANGHELPPFHQSNPDAKHFILGWTIEKIYLPYTSRLCARVEGKSSLGRMGLGVHVTAPTIHAGFGFNANANSPGDHGRQLRLEIWNVGPLPIVLTKGLRICQLIIEEVRETPNVGYSGEFNKQGPRPT